MEAINHINMTLPSYQVRPALQSLMYAIFFQRNLETIEPETREVVDTHIACAPSTAIEKEVNERVEEFSKKYLKDEGKGGYGYDKGEIALIFTQKKSRKGWFGITEELVPWEAHFITIHFAPHSTLSTSSPVLTDSLLQILHFCAERRYAVPMTGPGETERLSHQVIVSPPPPSDLFAPSPPYPARSPGPQPPYPTSAINREYVKPDTAGSGRTRRSSSPGVTRSRESGHSRDRDRDSKDVSAPGAMGYLEQAKDVLRATGARAGAVAGWTTSGRGRYG